MPWRWQAPTLRSYTETASWTTFTASKSTASAVSWEAGDILVFIGGSEGIGTIGVPTATGLTFVSAALNTTASTATTRGAVAVASAAGSQTISASFSGTSQFWGFGVWVWAGSEGGGSVGEQHTTTHTINAAPQRQHSAWCLAAFDFSATVVTGNSLTPTVTNSRQKQQSASHYSIYVGDITDLPSSASTAFGLTAGGTTGAISIVAIEVKGRPMWTRGYVPVQRASAW